HGEKTNVATYAFIDEGSSATFVDRKLIEELGVEGTLNPVCLKWTDDTTRNESESLEVNLQISSVHRGAKVYDLRNVHTLRELMLPTQTLPIQELVTLYPHMKGLPIDSYTNVVPRILIGVNNIHLGKPLRCVEGKFDEPIAAKTRLGWTVFGPCRVPAHSCKLLNDHYTSGCNRKDSARTSNG
uniref:Peptidase aspartic putative domain-containing protein n=1 Tax=Anopheles dirus TaxID=7168 RepID=A0A182NPY0_9DIPT